MTRDSVENMPRMEVYDRSESGRNTVGISLGRIGEYQRQHFWEGDLQEHAPQLICVRGVLWDDRMQRVRVKGDKHHTMEGM